jgi:phosphatidylserine/phosphatidylglycerophosphate/cardiolipin synthase-like enzyme
VTKPALPLSQLTRAELEWLRRAIARRQVPTPLTDAALRSNGKDKLFARVGVLADANEDVALALIDLALAVGETAPAAAARASATLVWTTPDVHLSKARSTTAVLLELFSSARERVLVAGYEFDHGAALFDPLHEAMAARGVKVDVFLEIDPAPSPKSVMASYLAVQAHRFIESNWPFGAPYPRLHYFPAGCEHGSRRSLHAKCVVVDCRHVLVGSANFTKRGHTRNVEVGVRIDDADLATAVVYQFERLLEQGAFAPLSYVPGATLPVAAEDEREVASNPAANAHEALAVELGVAAEAKPLLLRLLASGAPTPQVGDDIEGDDGEAIGSPELSWPRQRVAVLLPEQEADRRKLEGQRWTCFSMERATAELDTLRTLLAREG